METNFLAAKKPIYQGKAKSLYQAEHDNELWVEFRDDATAFNGEKKATIDQKGVINNKINAFVMEYLAKQNIPVHFIKRIDDRVSLIKHLKMLPLECVIRNVAAGSLCKRLGIEKAKLLSPPLFEFFLKDDALGDPLVTPSHIVTFGWATAEEMAQLEQLTRAVNDALVPLFDKAGLILVDFKLEFGYADGQLCLGDELTPDGCRIWDKKTQEILDKDRFRYDLGDLVEGYKVIANKLGVAL